MKRVLRIAGKGLYIRADGSQTNDFDQAANFPDVASAIEMCRRCQLEGVELVLRVGDPEDDIVTPLARL